MVRLEKVVAYTTVVVFAVIIAGSGVVPKLLQVRYLWSSQPRSLYMKQAISVKQWHELVKGWDWVKSYRLRWHFPFYIDVYVEAKEPIVQVDEKLYLDHIGHTFENKYYDYALPLANVNEYSYASIVEWVALIKQHGLNLKSISQQDSGITYFNLTDYSQIIVYDLNHLPKLERMTRVLKKPHRCYINDLRQVCHAISL